MTRHLRANATVTIAASAGLLTMAWLGLYDFGWNDYDTEASASVHELVSGHFLAFLQQAPSYGGSLLIRAPFALAPDLWGGGALADYRMLALPCMLAMGALAVGLVTRMRANGSSRLARGTLVGVLVGNPAMLYALEIGHAEEILAGVLCVVAMLAARSGRALTAGLLVGLAVATKSWALVAVAPVLVTLPTHRVRALLSAGAVAVAVLSPFLVAQHLHGSGAGVTVAGTGVIFQPQQLWWFLGAAHQIVLNSHGGVMVGFRAAPSWVSTLSHPLLIAITIPLSLLWHWRRAGRPTEPLALLTLALALRCMLDTWDNYYYVLPLLISLATWEVLARRDPPLLALAASAGTWVCFEKLPAYLSPDHQAIVFLALAVPAVLAIAMWLYAPQTWARLTAALSVPIVRGAAAPGVALSRR